MKPDNGIMMDDHGNASVFAVPAIAFQRAPSVVPPRNIDGDSLHVCPLCEQRWSWPAFIDHAHACIAAHPQLVAAIREGRERPA